jgi:hypothetical protein
MCYRPGLSHPYFIVLIICDVDFSNVLLPSLYYDKYNPREFVHKHTHSTVWK